MKLKKFLCWLLILALCFSLIACDEKTTKKSEEDAESSASDTEKDAATKDGKKGDTAPDTKDGEELAPLLYKVSDDDGDVIWLFGSIHVGQEDFYPLPDYVMDAFEGSDSLAVEVDVIAFEKDLSAQVEALMPLIYTDGTKIDDHIPEELYEKCVELFKENDSYTSMLDLYIPAFWSLTLNTLFYQSNDFGIELGVDRYLLDLAKDEDMEILEIESAEFQYGMFASFSEELQIYLLEQSVAAFESPDDSIKELNDLLRIWKNGNEKKLLAALLAEAPTGKQESKLYEEYVQAMTTDRNYEMASFAEDALEEGEEVFICVGAAHVVGPDAMVDILQDRGYEVECVTP